ncbi:MAG: helix-turn-helix transcriptional regulator [Cyanobacteria bacterium]|nr:helix-turn-helix transcriptional regulator [Cyanobacteriota bacterium]MDA0867094.1 helix-turn-helix transcriptional regulator [Cyanobacteriota bacterium]
MFSAPLVPDQPPNLIAFPLSIQTVDYLELIFETFLDQVLPLQGFMLLDQQGNLLQSSPKGRLLSQTLQLDTNGDAASGEAIALPPQIHHLAQSLVESRSLFPDQDFQLQDDVWLANNSQVCLQAMWVRLAQHPALIVITLTDVTAAIRQRARFDAYQYQLTPREREVWELHLQGHSYQQMGETLSITLNTVKKHMKSIHGKRRAESC